MMPSIPPKYAVSQVVGYIKGKSAIHFGLVYGERNKASSGSTFGSGDISFRRSGEMRGSSLSTSRTKRKRNSDWTS